MSNHTFSRPPEVYDPSQKDEEIIQVLKKAGFDPNSCMNCGMCTSSCLSGRWTNMRTRQIMNRAALGDASVLEDRDIWLCTTCYACYDRCPRDLKITDAIIELRNLASTRGLVSDKHRKTVAILHKTGHGVPINDKVMAIRKELGLPEIPPTIAKFSDDVEIISKTLFQIAAAKEEPKDE